MPARSRRSKRTILWIACVATALTFAGGLWRFLRPTVDAAVGFVAGDAIVSLDHGGLHRTYRLHVPPGTPPPRWPVVIALHGRARDSWWMARRTGLDAVADRERFVVVYPTARSFRWNDGFTPSGSDDVGFLSAALEQVANTLPVDRDRIFLTGISNGGMMAYRFACESPGIVAAVAPVAGQLAESIAPSCRSPHPASMLAVGGTADHVIPWDGVRGFLLSAEDSVAPWVAADGCEPRPVPVPAPGSVRRRGFANCRGLLAVELAEIPGGGHDWPRGRRKDGGFSASEEIWRFFTAHPRPPAGPAGPAGG